MMLEKEEVAVRKMDASTIFPASITVAPNLQLNGSGLIEVSSPPGNDPSLTSSYVIDTSWRVLGLLNVDLETSWNIGEGSWYWYRVEGVCGSVVCDEYGVEHRNCNRMTVVTTVSARSVTELCETLTSPRFNQPASFKVSSIKRFARPMFKDQIDPGQCNVLSDVEFCHIPECFDYCVDVPAAGMVGDLIASEDGLAVADTTYADLLPFSGAISACGCPNVGGSIVVRHTLGRSANFARFVNSNGLENPGSFSLIHRSDDSSWNSAVHLNGSSEKWIISMSLACQSEEWRMSLAVRSGALQTKLVLDRPGDLLCQYSSISKSIRCYFGGSSKSATNGLSFEVRSPPRKELRSTTYAVECFVDGVFVPHTVYYDDLGIFDDDFWAYSPLELDFNPSSKNRYSVMTLSGIV